MKVDIAVAVHNALHWVRPCLASLRAYTPEDHRLVIVNDASDAHVAVEVEAILADWPRPAKLLHNDLNVGYLRSINRAIANGESPAVVVLNSDALVTPGWLTGLLNCLESDNRIGVASPLASHANFTRFPVPDGHDYLSLARVIRRTSPKRYPEIGLASGFCMIARRSLYEAVGLFDEVYGHGYYEEADFCLRAHEQGFRVVADDGTFIWHNGWTTFGTDERTGWMTRNRRLFERRWGRAHDTWHKRFVEERPLQGVIDAVALELQRPASAAHRAPKARGRRRQQVKSIRKQIFPEQPTYALRVPDKWRALAEIVQSRPPVLTDHPRVLYILPGLGPWGGVVSVLQLVNRLLQRGFDATAATCGAVAAGWDSQMFFRPWLFSSRDDMIEHLPPYDLVVATRWDTVYDALMLCERWNSRLAYFVQGLEPAGLREGSAQHEAAWNTFALAPDQIVKSTWLRDRISPHGGRVSQIPLGLDRDVFYPGQPLPRGERHMVVAASRPGVVVRNHEATLEIFRRLLERRNDVIPVFFGKPFKVSSPRMQHAGSLSMPRVASLLRGASVLIDPSLEQVFGRPGIEAMACGTNAVLTCRGGISEYAFNGVNCLQYEPMDVDGFVEGVCRFLDDEDLATQCRDNGLTMAATFDAELEADATATLFRSLLS